jgi:hypothetical protein
MKTKKENGLAGKSKAESKKTVVLSRVEKNKNEERRIYTLAAAVAMSLVATMGWEAVSL